MHILHIIAVECWRPNNYRWPDSVDACFQQWSHKKPEYSGILLSSRFVLWFVLHMSVFVPNHPISFVLFLVFVLFCSNQFTENATFHWTLCINFWIREITKNSHKHTHTQQIPQEMRFSQLSEEPVGKKRTTFFDSLQCKWSLIFFRE